MYTLVQKNMKVIKQLIEINLMKQHIWDADYLSAAEKDAHTRKCHDESKQMIAHCSLDDLKVIYTLSSIGSHERGSREYLYKSAPPEIIELEIKESPEELLAKHSRYIKFYSREELEFYILGYTLLASTLQEGLNILKIK